MRPDSFYHTRDVNRRFFAFDMFGTLVTNCKGTVLPIFETLCTYYPGVTPEEINSTYHGLTRQFKDTHTDRELPIDVIISHLDVVFGFNHNADEMEKPLLRDTKLFVAAEGAEKTLRYLKEHGYRIGVFSNTRYHSFTLWGLLEDTGLSQYIDEVVASADVGIRKPDPQSYQSIFDRLGCTKHECYYAGDSASKDYYGPLATGIRGAVLIDPAHSVNGRGVVSSIGDIPDLFEKQ